jgi:hypothetical protein
MANKAIAGKISSTSKVKSTPAASVKLVAKPRTKIPESRAAVELVSPSRQSKSAASAKGAVIAQPEFRSKAGKSIAVESAQQTQKKTARKAAPLKAVSSSSKAVAKAEQSVKSLKTKSARNLKLDWETPGSWQEPTEKAVRKVDDPSAMDDANELAQIMAFSAADARPQSSARLSDSSIRIFQIYYHERQSPFLDSDFELYDNAEDNSPLLEFNVFTKLLQKKELQDVKLWGAVSWKFGQKTGISGAQFKEEIATNPGYDVYFCNPHSEAEALYHNLWLQGETAHPNFIALCKEIFEVAELSPDLLTEIQPALNFATANYFVATPQFWKRYAAFVSRVLLAANKKLSPTARAILFSSTADPSGVHAQASYIPFVIERLFSVFLQTDGHDFRAYKIAPQVPEEQANVHLKLLREMRNVACRTKSVWMASCWVNYRNLYLTNAYGAPWAKRYLRSITPQTVLFGPDADNIASEATGK